MMYCPICRAPNEVEAEICQNCDFEFSSHAGQNHQGLSITKFIAIDIFNLTFVFLAVIALAVTLSGYLLWKFFMPTLLPVQPWVMAIKNDGDKLQLYALNWQDEISFRITESEGDWYPNIHLAISSPSPSEAFQNIYSGHWNGGQAILFPNSTKAVFAIRQGERYQVNLIDLQTGQLETLEETVNVEPFISVAPTHNLTAVSIPATEEKIASLSVFSNTNKLDIGRSLEQTRSAEGKLAPNGQHLLYTVTMSETNITQIMTNTLTMIGAEVITDTQVMTPNQAIPDAPIMTITQVITATQALTDTQVMTTTQVTTTTQHIHHSTLYLTDINGIVENILYEFDQVTRELPDNYSYAFSPNSQSVVYETPQMDLFMTDLQNQNTTKFFTSTEDVASIDWYIAPGSDHLILLLFKQQNSNQVDLIHISLETGERIPFEEAFPSANLSPPIFLNSEQLLYSSPSNNPMLYNFIKHTRSRIPLSAQKPIPQLATKDMGLITFIISNTNRTSFNFLNVFQNDAALALDFEVDNLVIGHELANQYVVYQDSNTLYVKDILNDSLPVSIATSDSGFFLTHFTTNPNYLLYTTKTEEQTNIYGVDLRNQQSKRLLENAQLLNELNETFFKDHQ